MNDLPVKDPATPRDPLPSTLNRMRQAAADEATRIEGSQRARVLAGFIMEPLECQMLKRDDFHGLVLLIDRISANEIIMAELMKKARPSK